MGAGLGARLRRARVLSKHDDTRSSWNQAGLGFSAVRRVVLASGWRQVLTSLFNGFGITGLFPIFIVVL